MSASWSGSMRGPRVKTPFLLLLLLLLSALTGTVLCQDYEGDGDPGAEDAAQVEEENVGEETSESAASSANPDTTPTTASTEQATGGTFLEETESSTGNQYEGSGMTYSTEESPPLEDSLNPIIILIPVVLVVVIIGMIVCGIFIKRRWKKKASNPELGKEDPYLDGSSTEKVPMPMFEEDVPSVLELEMEELDQWMKKEEDSKNA